MIFLVVPVAEKIMTTVKTTMRSPIVWLCLCVVFFVDLLELLEELGLGRVARLLPRAEGVERDLVRGRVE